MENKLKNYDTVYSLVKSKMIKSYIIIQSSYERLKVEECNEPSCEALIFPYGVVLFNIFSTICI